MLLDDGGIPLFDPTVWSITRYRQKSAATVEQALRGAMLIHLFCWRHGIDLAERIRAGTFFEVGELDALVSDASKPFAHLRTAAKVLSTSEFFPLRSRSAARFLRRLPTTARVQTVAPETTRIRLHYATSYLRWLGERQKSRFSSGAIGTDEAFVRAHEYGVRLVDVVEQIEERAPSVSRKGRISLESEQRARLLEVVHPDSRINPWSDPFVRLRNWVIVCWLLGTGMRRGELLGLRVRDFNRGQAYCEIKRRQDDKRDQRRRQPNAKTLERVAPLDEVLTSLGEQYLEVRNKIELARKHGILFVAEDGKPLSDSAITGMFALLRERHPDVGSVSAHVLRHQWNEDFSTYADTSGLGSDEEVQLRCFLMGWTPKSRMPGHYLKRRTKAKADEHSKEMQRRLMKHGPEIHQRIKHVDQKAHALNDEAVGAGG
ncbi:site-specific integrase [Methylobacterium fujisawaense]|uniref:tyrosine-type recombinase/integrase n=1 Tax=Methylobacterium fujisawaense TaxID=107400 RepID=UPI0031F528DD